MAVEWLRISGGGRDASVVATASAASAAVLLLEIACRLILLVVSDALSIPLRRIPKRRVPREMPQVSENLYHSRPRNIPSLYPLPSPRRRHLPSSSPFSFFSSSPLTILPLCFFLFLLTLLPFFLTSFSRFFAFYLILLSGHRHLSFVLSSICPLLLLLSANVHRAFFLACSVVRADSTHTYARIRVCTRPLFDSRDITLSRGSFCDGGVYRGNALLSID